MPFRTAGVCLPGTVPAQRAPGSRHLPVGAYSYTRLLAPRLHPECILVARQRLLVMPRLQAINDCWRVWVLVGAYSYTRLQDDQTPQPPDAPAGRLYPILVPQFRSSAVPYRAYGFPTRTR
jgi:hypothetical protein